ncbi:MAG: hypothetical protein KGL48_12185 [Sphingomonadales bacterium]|nr:hypothetical protein [Sphingomonadales bacterium]MDE2568242.1 hypothetical protein [Sphingomonadales bacterium]
MSEPKDGNGQKGGGLDFAGLTALSFQVVVTLYFLMMLSASLARLGPWLGASPILAMPVICVIVAVKWKRYRWPAIFLAGLALDVALAGAFVAFNR